MFDVIDDVNVNEKIKSLKRDSMKREATEHNGDRMKMLNYKKHKFLNKKWNKNDKENW